MGQFRKLFSRMAGLTRRLSLFPKAYCKSAYDIDYEGLYQEGCRGVIFDIDNTLVEDQQEATKKAADLLEKIRRIGMEAFVLSNNHEERVRLFSEAVGARYIYEAGKPSAKGYIRAMEIMGTDRASTVFVGDQIYTDIWGANNAGVFSILVPPVNPRELLHIRLKRLLELPVLMAYRLTNHV
jgi:HAD superfamily phosphatase (TIGR01668 family)